MTYRLSIAERIAATPGLRPTETKVLQALASWAHFETGMNARPKWASLIRKSGLSRATVARCLRRLEAEHWIEATHRAHRHATTYRICLVRLAPQTTETTEATMSMHHHPAFESHVETQNPPLESQIETQLGLNLRPRSQVLDPSTHTDARTREALLPGLIGAVPPPACTNQAHAWHGRVCVPKDLHFEFLRRMGGPLDEIPHRKAGRLVAFYAATLASIPTTDSIGDEAYKFWRTRFAGAFLSVGEATTTPSTRRLERSGSICPHAPRCETRHACVDRTLTEARAERERHSG